MRFGVNAVFWRKYLIDRELDCKLFSGLFYGFPGSFPLLCGMKESYSICFTSHDEVMFRDEADHGMFLNIMAIEAYRTE